MPGSKRRGKGKEGNETEKKTHFKTDHFFYAARRMVFVWKPLSISAHYMLVCTHKKCLQSQFVLHPHCQKWHRRDFPCKIEKTENLQK
jgi:hypothetical protein